MPRHPTGPVAIFPSGPVREAAERPDSPVTASRKQWHEHRRTTVAILATRSAVFAFLFEPKNWYFFGDED